MVSEKQPVAVFHFSYAVAYQAKLRGLRGHCHYYINVMITPIYFDLVCPRVRGLEAAPPLTQVLASLTQNGDFSCVTH
jgi:hypothetical protein